MFVCGAGGAGGNGFMALRHAEPQSAQAQTDLVLPGRGR